ncbi:hypothetical protein BW21_5132 [Burkholderia humptydooensis]|nr:hypothetical protein BW21_5132 [Burkholderia sp. 2002721687]
MPRCISFGVARHARQTECETEAEPRATPAVHLDAPLTPTRSC